MGGFRIEGLLLSVELVLGWNELWGNDDSFPEMEKESTSYILAESRLAVCIGT